VNDTDFSLSKESNEDVEKSIKDIDRKIRMDGSWVKSG
jgi:hypothetical protein